MKLYFTPGACSLSPHIVLSEAGFPYTLEQVDLKTKLTASGEDFNTINAKSAVPVLELDNGERLTEGSAIIQYLADQQPSNQLAPANGTLERTRLQEWLNFISTEIHKGYGPIIRVADVGEQASHYYLQKLKKTFSFVAEQLGDKPYLVGDGFTIADAYLFTTLSWHKWINLDLSEWPVLEAYQARIAARPKVQAALLAEGLLAQ
jgi:glutathione S-transferase